MHFLNLAATTLIGSFVALSNAHPGADHKREAREHMAAVQAAHLPNDLSHCAEILRRDGHEQRAIERRMEVLRSEREQRGLSTGTSLFRSRWK